MKIFLFTNLIMVILFMNVSSQASGTEKISMNRSLKILVLFNSKKGGTYRLAKEIARGIEELPNTKAILKRISSIESSDAHIDNELKNVPIATVNNLTQYDGIAFGSPVHFGNISADMRFFLDHTIELWVERKLQGIPATVFMSAGSGLGNESAILSFWFTLASHGMIIVPMGNMSMNKIDKSIPLGSTPFGITTLSGHNSFSKITRINFSKNCLRVKK